ncbi:glycoside hydrolase family 5 protein [Mucilaginibacter flavidus]|uniref:glycoside hydrolase family 5 protein n=1 Tax=Mucilaginibacter flavidus TaxID=2949309 RepID=UPI002093CFE7|nr:cellulase family glycosylhydrolase [Mucilaginibacter flavidus]MCO5949780.1 glycoside hydrolase family 5 protein [Mucilaginibacter flavidus]
MKKLVLVLLLSVLMGPAVIKAQTQKFITVKGKQVIGPDNKPFLMRGTNLGNWLVPEGYMFKFKSVNSPKLINQALSEIMGPEDVKAFWKKYQDTYITAADIHFLKASGMNSIRIPFNYRLFTAESYMGENNPNRGFELLDRVIGWCKKESLYVILDMHAAPGGQTGDNIDDGYGYPFLFKSKASQQLTIDIWHRIAAHYANSTTVMGYDLLNEPIATYFKADEFNQYLEPLYQKITKSIRLVDKNHIVILGGAQWDSNFKPFGPPFDSKLIYQFHKYWTEPIQNVIQDYVDFSNKYNVPIYCGETGENKDGWVKTFKDLLEKNNIGWHYWPYKKLDNTAGIITFDVPAGYDKVIDYTEKNRSTFEDIRKAAPENREELVKALYGFLNNCKFENCKPNKGYMEALGFKVP